MKFNWDEFRNGKVAVNCDTEEKAREFIKECHERGMKWFFLNINDTNWSNFKESTCYSYSLNSGDLKFGHKSKFEAVDYKIIKWESEKMKFKVGDKVRVINNGLSFTTHTMANKWLREIKNSKPYNYNNAPKNGSVGFVRDIVKAPSFETPTLILEIENYSYLILMDGVELIESLTEFTFQEVVARNIPGVYVNCNDDMARVQSIEINEDGDFGINADFKGLKEINLGLGINHNLKFKLQEPIKIATIYKVEHKKDGKKYDFISSQRLHKEMFVVCDTSQGKSYGRIVDIETRELTEEEYKQYKECWRA